VKKIFLIPEFHICSPSISLLITSLSGWKQISFVFYNYATLSPTLEVERDHFKNGIKYIVKIKGLDFLCEIIPCSSVYKRAIPVIAFATNSIDASWSTMMYLQSFFRVVIIVFTRSREKLLVCIFYVHYFCSRHFSLSYRHAVIFANLRKVKRARCPQNHLNQFKEDKMKREEDNCVFSHSMLIEMRATIMKMSLDNVKLIILMKRTCMHIRISFYVSTMYNCCERELTWSSFDKHALWRHSLRFKINCLIYYNNISRRVSIILMIH